MIPEDVRQAWANITRYLAEVDVVPPSYDDIMTVDTWLAAQPAAEWRPVEDGDYPVDASVYYAAVDCTLSVREGDLLSLVLDDGGITVNLPPTLRLCERVLAEAEVAP